MKVNEIEAKETLKKSGNKHTAFKLKSISNISNLTYKIQTFLCYSSQLDKKFPTSLSHLFLRNACPWMLRLGGDSTRLSTTPLSKTVYLYLVLGKQKDHLGWRRVNLSLFPTGS